MPVREPVNLEEELQQEQERAQALEEENQRERLQMLQQQEEEQQAESSQKAQIKNAAKEVARDYAKQTAKKYAWGFLASTSEIWVPILGFLLLIAATIGLVLIIATSASAYCNQGGVKGFAATVASKTASWVGLLPNDVCAALSFGGQEAPGSITTGQPTPGTATDEALRKLLADNGISVNHPYPTTSLVGMRMTTIQELINFKQACDNWASPNTCTVVVTGGTEDAHAEGFCSHQNGYKADIRVNGLVSSFITSSGQFRDSGFRSDGAHMYTEQSSGAIWALESDHWDMVVGCGGNA